jgi:glycogen debranching enzyme
VTGSALTILEGSTFCISDEVGDIGEETSGFFAQDTRFLSALRLRVNGGRPLPLSSGPVEHFSAAFYLRNPLAGDLAQDSVAVVRERFVGQALHERITLRNLTPGTVRLELTIELAADFADILSVKQRDFSLGDPRNAPPLPAPGRVVSTADPDQLVVEEARGGARTQVFVSRAAEPAGGVLTYPVELAGHTAWTIALNVVPSLDGALVPRAAAPRRFGEERAHVQSSLSQWNDQTPSLHSTSRIVQRSFDRSVRDLAALRMHSEHDDVPLPAAGMPWFMAVFGRDTLITSLQTMLLGPRLATGALGALARLQAHELDPSIDAEPGKIVHEVREGRAAERWFRRYYGTVDATPLYLILLSEVWRWTGDPAIASRFREPALEALAWIDRHGDRDGDGFVEYQRRTPDGLDNQSWKDSHDSQRFHDGRFAATPIAPAEVQGYVYDAKRRMAELAGAAWNDGGTADRLEREAAALRERFDASFWIGDADTGFYALGLDRDKRPMDSRCSNMGHLLWSGIVPDARVEEVCERVFEPALWSGWGIRTMATDDAAFNPLGYHTGTVWPHDSSLVAWGLMRCGHRDRGLQIVHALLDACLHFGWSLPEVFAGFDREETPFPIAYPTAARPQAWAAGTPVLLMRLLLGIEPDPAARTLRTAGEGLPEWAGEVQISGVPAFGRRWDIRGGHGAVEAAPSA